MASTQQTRVIIGIESGAKLHELLREPQMPSMKMVDEWRENPVFEQQYAAAAATGAATREAEKQKMEKRRNKTAARTDFTFVGVPTTVAGTPDDERRQQLSRRLTAIIADNYTTPPGCPVAAAPEPKPLILTPAVMPKPARLTPEGEAALKQTVLARLRIGDTFPVIERQTPGFYTNKAIAWRKDPAFAAEWNAAVAAGRHRRGLGPKLPRAIRSTRPAPVGHSTNARSTAPRTPAMKLFCRPPGG